MEKNYVVTKDQLNEYLDGGTSEQITLKDGKIIERTAAYAAYGYMAQSGVQEVQFTPGTKCPCIPGCPAFPKCKDGNG